MSVGQELQKLQATGDWSQQNQSMAEEASASIYDFPIVYNSQVNMYLELFQGKQRRQFGQWLEKSGKYLPIMEAELAKKGLPLDLVYLAMIESGYNQRAFSHASAVGLWQFMKGTGRQYGLRVDSYVDERRNALKSTQAAVAYLSDLHEQFGDWYLAVAAYNAGPGKVRYGLRKYGVDNFWDLAGKKHLRLETKKYVPKLIATIIIARDPEKYGFKKLDYQKPLLRDQIEVTPGLSLTAVATIAGTNVKGIKELNQELKREKTPLNVSTYSINIPYGTAELARRNLPRLHSTLGTGYKIHIVKRSESLAAICRKYKINRTTIARVNKLHSSKLARGKRLRIPYPTIKYQLLPQGETDAQIAYKDSLILHSIKKGETISKIARRYHVPVDLILSWNGLKSANRIREGQQLALYIDRGQSKRNSLGRVYILAGDKKRKIDQGVSGTWYQVRNGDSLWTISRKFNISMRDIRKLNNMKTNLIHPGNKLRIIKG
ncbi:lytic transglycosylase domain-containing protein [Desulfotalea psychrophila]|nr:lytic transglycosylase domain-containing protein [Desulfotalea psychrophila]